MKEKRKNNDEILKEALKKQIEDIEGLDCIESGKGLFFKKREKEENWEFVKRTFCDDMSKKTFYKLYEQAINGSGGEGKNMNNVISSALFPFLFFSKVSSRNYIKIDGVKYTRVCFEYKNRTLNGNTDSAPSNIDVVLADKEYYNIMFIESKFGEYFYSAKKTCKLSIEYDINGGTKGIFESLQERLKGSSIKIIKDNENIVFSDKKEKHYFEGIKQIITHISGLYNYMEGNHCDCNTFNIFDKDKQKIKDKYREAKFKLQEIVFDFSAFGLGKDELEDYKDLHEKIFGDKELFPDIKIGKLKTYQDIIKNNKCYISNLDKKIIKLYNLN
ncbi:MAG: hypothetical protein K6E74_03250 [Bacilli bacterium]|nr:hypothetical protein [Bacilli bacterium]